MDRPGPRLVAELVAVVVLGMFGWHLGGAQPWKALLAVVFVAVGIVLWGLFASPKATYDVAWLTIAVKVLVLGVKVLALGVAVIGSQAMGHRTLAIVFAIAVVVQHIAAALPAIAKHGETNWAAQSGTSASAVLVDRMLSL